MITPQNRIIIVDDDQEELESLSKVFLKIGVGCRIFEYDNTYDEPLNNVRLAFFDINLNEKVVNFDGLSTEDIEKNASPIYNDLAVALNNYISTDNGPYALVFWTKNEILINGFKNYINDPKRGFSETAKPFYITCIDKVEAKNGNLLTILNEVLENDKIKFYFEIEENARKAGSEVINKLHSIIPKDEKWSENFEYFENIDNVLSKIAVNVLGYKYAKENPMKGVYEGLSQLVLKEFLNLDSKINTDKLMSNLATKAHHLLTFPSNEIQAKLNSIFHLDEATDFTVHQRGGVFGINLDYLNSSNFCPSYYFSLGGYYNCFEKYCSKLFFRLNSDIPEDEYATIKSKIELIAVEISASCDYSQNKLRNNKYILGLLTPAIDISYIDKKSIGKSILYKDIPNFYYLEQEYSIYLNLNFVFSDSDLEFISEPKFILKKELVDMIGNRYSNHVSRIGITSF